MQGNSLWLGRFRATIKFGMIIFVGITVALYLYLVTLRIFSADAYGMFEMIRPEGRPLVLTTLVSLGLALLFATLFLSNRLGVIETKPEGFFDLVSVVLVRLAMIFVAFIVLVMFNEVVSRYIFSKPTL